MFSYNYLKLLLKNESISFWILKIKLIIISTIIKHFKKRNQLKNAFSEIMRGNCGFKNHFNCKIIILYNLQLIKLIYN